MIAVSSTAFPVRPLPPLAIPLRVGKLVNVTARGGGVCFRPPHGAPRRRCESSAIRIFFLAVPSLYNNSAGECEALARSLKRWEIAPSAWRNTLSFILGRLAQALKIVSRFAPALTCTSMNL